MAGFNGNASGAWLGGGFGGFPRFLAVAADREYVIV